MNRHGKPRLVRPVNRRNALSFIGGALTAAAGGFPAYGQGRPPGGPRAPEPMPSVPPTATRILDVHAHFYAAPNHDIRSALQGALKMKDQLGIARTLIMPPPQPPGHRNLYDYDSFVPIIRPYADRFGFLGGGGTLNPLIQRHGGESSVPEATRREFEAMAERILAAGAVGFGEITAHHLSFFAQHPYEATPADNPLLRQLADIAARRNVPIDLHMDPVPEDMPLPARFHERTNNNPRVVKENIGGLERLLAHNRSARIVWAHAGRDTVGTWTLALSRTLLGRHPNLFMSLSIHPPFGVVPENSLIDAERQPNRKWLELVAEFPDRFVVGTDYFHQGQDRGGGQVLPPPTPAIRRFIDALPPALAARVAHGNAERIYAIKLS